MELKKTPLHASHQKLGAKLVPFAGYELPIKYSSEIEEHLAVRNEAGIFDVSHMGEFMIEGSGALTLIQNLTSNDASALSNGQIQYSCLLNSSGGIVDDLLVYKFSEEKYMLVVNAANIQKDLDWINSNNVYGAEVKDISTKIGQIALQGPKSKKILEKLTNLDLDSLKYYHFETTEVSDIQGVIVSATGYTGAGGYELYAPNELISQLWEIILETGGPEGLKPTGLGCRDTLRLEMGFCLYGNDINEETTPYEAGLGWVTKLDKEFICKDLLVETKKNGISKKLVGIELIDRGVPRAGYQILSSDGEYIGQLTSGSISPITKKGIGMGYVRTEFSLKGTEVKIAVRNRVLKAIIKKPPFIS